MATEQKKTKTAKSSNSRRRGSARNSKANGSNSRTPSRKINATQQATAPQQDAVLIAPPKYRKGSMISATSRTVSTRLTPWCSPTAMKTTSVACLTC